MIESAVAAPHPAGGAPETATRREEHLVLGGAAALAIFACLWSTLGASLSDDAHNIALAWRLSLGDAPFADEMNTQALGSLLAVPFVWVWTHLFGMNGLVLASRLFFVAFAFSAGFVAYKALRTTLRPVTAAVAVAAPLMALPYHLGQISYNTVPIIGLVVGTAAGFAVVVTQDRRWAFVCGAAIAVGVLSLPLIAPGGVILLIAVVVLSWRREVIAFLMAGGLAVSIPFILWIVVGVGWPAVQDTLRFTLDYQELRLPVEERARRAVNAYTSYLGLARYWPMWAAVVVAAIPTVGRSIRMAAAAAIPALAAAPSIYATLYGPSEVAFGKLAGIYATALSLALFIPITVWVIQQQRRDLGVLLVLTVPVAIPQVPLIGSLTSSGVGWGVHVIGACSLLMALVAGWCEMIDEWVPRMQPVLVTSVVIVIGTLLVLRPFKDPYPWELTTRIMSGPFAGIATTPGRAALIEDTESAAERWVGPDEGVLFYGLAGDYLLTTGKPTTNIMWLANYGSANQSTLDYFAQSGRTPDVVFVSRGLVDAEGGYGVLARRDPLIAYIVANYHIVDPQASNTTVFRRN